jgi:hypothetical protein
MSIHEKKYWKKKQEKTENSNEWKKEREKKKQIVKIALVDIAQQDRCKKEQIIKD